MPETSARGIGKCVVTGGAGFIGSALVRTLLAEGVPEVVALDNFSSGKRANLAGLESQVKVAEADIRDRDAVARSFHGADRVFHLAAIPSVPVSIKNPEPSHDSNINGTWNVFRAASEAKVGRVIYAASSSAYGNTEVLPKVESMRPMPLSPYAVQKLVGELYGAVFHQCFGLETTSLRFFNVYGPRQDPSSPYSGVLSLFMTALLDRRAPTIFGDGEQTRDFTYVEDVTALLWKAAIAPVAAGKVYNAGNGGQFSLNEVWRTLQRIEGVEIPPHYGPWREGDVRDSQADTTAARHELGHTPRFSLEDGLRLTLEWYRVTHVAKA